MATGSGIRPLQLPEWKQPPLVSFHGIGAAIGAGIDRYKEEDERKREGEAFGGLVDAAQGTTPPAPQELPRGLRNNNPGNIEDGPLARSLPGYKGVEPDNPQTYGKGRFAIFDTPESGLNAMDALLVSYGRRGLKTALDVTNRWAPKNPKDPDNDPVKYATYIGGGDPNKPIDFANPEERKKIVQAMARWENGMHPGAVQGVNPGGGMPPELAKKVRALFAVGTPAARAAAAELVNRFLPGGKDDRTKLGADEVLVDREGREIARGLPKTHRRDRETTEEAIATRTAIAKERGLDPTDPRVERWILTGQMQDEKPEKPTPAQTEEEKIAAGVAARTKIIKDRGGDPKDPRHEQFILTGKTGKEEGVSPTVLKMIEAAEDENTNLATSTESLKRALEINEDIFTGVGAKARTWAGTKLKDWMVPDALADPKTAQLTEEWVKLMNPEAINTMAATLKGATTDFELRKFVELLSDPETTSATRKRVLDRMLTLSQRKIRDNERKMDQLRGRDYGKAGGGQSVDRQATTPGKGQSAPAPEAAARTIEAAKAAVARGDWTLEQANAELQRQGLPPLPAGQ